MSRASLRSCSFQEMQSSPRKISFQTRLKLRGTNQFLDQPGLNSSISKQQLHHDQSQKNIKNVGMDSNLASSSSEILKNSNFSLNSHFQHHESQKCLCNQCLCGRHFCNLRVKKPDLRKSTVYQKSFRTNKSKSYKNTPIMQKQQNRSLAKVQMNSTYCLSFKNNDIGTVVKHHPEDELKFEGPAQKLTSYRANFPGNYGQSPYIRPKQVYLSGSFPFKNKRSAYRQSYVRFEDARKAESGKINDQLKTGYNALFRQSFYQQKFKPTNPEDFQQVTKNVQKLEINPNFAHQYESSYDKQFVKFQPARCPAKINLETRYKNTFSNDKESFAENSDFKAFSNSYHALSIAPYGQYQ